MFKIKNKNRDYELEWIEAERQLAILEWENYVWLYRDRYVDDKGKWQD